MTLEGSIPHFDLTPQSRPIALPISPLSIPEDLKALIQWVTWRYTWLEDRHVWDKPPKRASTGKPASTTNPHTWATFAAALTAYEHQDLDGIGFVLNEHNDLVGVDLDYCRNPDTGEIASWAMKIVSTLNSYTEVSPSGTGLRIWLRAKRSRHGRKKGPIEVYSWGRYLTVTGCHVEGTPLTLEARQEELDALEVEVFAASPKPKPLRRHIQTENENTSTLTEDMVIEKALSARNGPKFARLWSGDTRDYPSPSEADLALCALLAFWTQDAGQIDRLYRRSALHRDKWDEVHGESTYGERTIALAITGRTERWRPPPKRSKDMREADSLNSHNDPPRSPTNNDANREESTPELPEILLTTKRPLRDLISDALAYWTRANQPSQVFVRGGELVRVRSDENGRPIIDQMQESHVRGALMRCVNFGIMAENRGTKALEFQHKTPPKDIVLDILAQGQWQFPGLEGVIELPIMRPDGSILTRPGYDASTALYYHPDPALQVPEIPLHPNTAQIDAARALIQETIGEFPYLDDASKANAWAALFTPMMRHLVKGSVPLALIDKPQAGTGASLFASVITLITTGRHAACMAAPAKDEDWRKALTAILQSGSTVILIDNVDYPLWAPSLYMALTAPVWTDRVLGLSTMATLPIRVSWYATGNNLKLRGDLPRRCYWVRMDAKTSRPWMRTTFTHPNLFAWVTDNRAKLLAALLTLVRAWHMADRPPADVPRLGGFEEWTSILGSLLGFLKIPGFLANLDELYAQSDEDGPQWEAFLTAWAIRFGEKVMTVSQLCDELQDENLPLYQMLPEELLDALPKKTEGWGGFSRKLGRALTKRAQRRYGPQNLYLVLQPQFGGTLFPMNSGGLVHGGDDSIVGARAQSVAPLHRATVPPG